VASKDIQPSREDKLATRRAAEQDVLMREVDEAVRQEELQSFVRRYGILLGIAALVGLLALGGGLWWYEHRQGQLEERSEKLITALDALEARRLDEAKQQFAPLAEDSGSAAAAAAKLSLAAIAIQENRTADAVKQFEAVAADADAPQPYRDLATIRAVAANFEGMKPEQVVERLSPLAKPGNPWFGSAGEIVAMAHLKQNRNDLAGPLLAEVAKDEGVPATIRSRTRQLAGLLGYDAVVDVSQTLDQLQREQGGAAPAPAAAAPAP